MYIIAGLGNPGLKYKNTRHNVGWAAVDALAEETGAHFNKKRFDSKIAECRITGQRVALLKPLTYMNLSGRAVRAAAAYYKVPPENIIVIYDDVDLPIGRIRIRGRGSAGTHNGMRSVVGETGSEEMARIRIGIGKNPPYMDLAAYVLAKLKGPEKAALQKSEEDAAQAAVLIVGSGIAAAQQKYN